MPHRHHQHRHEPQQHPDDARQPVAHEAVTAHRDLEGALEAHTQAVRAGASASICLNGRRLEPSMAKNLYTTELKRNADLYEADMPVQMVLLNALATAYLC